MLDIVLVNHHTSFQVLADYSSIYWTSNVPSILPNSMIFQQGDVLPHLFPWQVAVP